jgi:putative flavoprotein involved in K+ transport
MPSTRVVIVGAGQAGLAVSYHLTTASIDQPSLQIVGSPPHPGRDARDVDLPALHARGVRISGRLTGIDGTRVEFADDLQVNAAAAGAGLTRLLHRIDDHVIATGLEFTVGPAAAPRPFTPNTGAATRVELRSAGISSVVWATGYRRRYPWLQVPVLDGGGEIRHAAGLTAAPGLVVVGQRWQTRRSSTFLDGVRHDAGLVVDHLTAGVLAHSRRKAS